MLEPKITLFDLDNPEHRTAKDLFESASDLPLICPHGHVDPGIFLGLETKFKNPVALFITPDHYVLRMLISQGFTFEELGVYPLLGTNSAYDPHCVWHIFCENFSLFDGTPTGLWIQNELAMVFGIDEKPTAQNAEDLFMEIQNVLDREAFSPRQLYQQFNIETLCTTDSPEEPLAAHTAIKNSDWEADIRPTFRADKLIHIGLPGWAKRIRALEKLLGQDISSFKRYLIAIQARREQFIAAGAVATDHSVETPFSGRLSDQQAESLFQKGLLGDASREEAQQFIGHMILEMARMSLADGLVMQLRAGPYRNHSIRIHQTYGPDRGFDIPFRVEWTRNLKPLLDAYGLEPRLRIILFTLDETSYARELAPLAGAYPSIKLGPPWWFHDSPNGILRYFENVMETAGFENTVGFNDDTSAFLSIPARHDLWRRMSALWLAGLLHRRQLDRPTAEGRMADLAYHLVKRGYRLDA